MYTTRTSLINKLTSGDEIGWEEFEKAYRNLMVSVALKQGVVPSDIDDIIQDVMLALFNHGNFNYNRETHGKFRTYLGGILRHKTADYFRRKKNLPIPDELENTEYILPEFESVYLAEYRQYILKAAINELKLKVTPEYFEVFQLCILREFSDKQAAEILGEKANTITVRKKRCREVLQKIISDLNAEDEGLELSFL